MRVVEAMRRLGAVRSAGDIAADSRGSVATEFAIVAPILFTAMIGVMELAFVLIVSSLMEGALRDASRFGITGFVPDGTTREEQILRIVEDRTIGLVDMDDVVVETKTYSSFGAVGDPEPYTDANGNGEYDPGESYTDVNGNGQWDADQGEDGAGDADAVVLYRIRYDLPLLTGFLGDSFGQDGSFPLSASVVVRNEPFDFNQ